MIDQILQNPGVGSILIVVFILAMACLLPLLAAGALRLYDHLRGYGIHPRSSYQTLVYDIDRQDWVPADSKRGSLKR